VHALPFLHKFLFNTLPQIHFKRLEALFSVVASLLNNGSLSLTALGKSMIGPALVKHKIKRVDRLLNNPHLYKERFYIYEKIAEKLFSSLKKVVILVDWSGCCSQKSWILQASVAAHGRSIPIYKEIHPSSKLGDEWVEKQFLKQLSKIISDSVHVTVVTDTGFKTPWFRSVRKLDWHFVGRLRGRVYTQLVQGEWQEPKAYYAKATSKARCLGAGLIGKSVRSIKAFFHLYKGLAKSSKPLKKRKGYGASSDLEKRHISSSQDPWFIVTSLSYTPQQVSSLYKKRRQIEQNFRDDKSGRFGFGLRTSRTQSIKKLEMLLLISFIATMLLWLIGAAAEAKNLHWGFQANTKKRHRVLSLLNLAKLVLQHCTEKICSQDLLEALSTIHQYQRPQEV